jgi:FtsP/CotA-like multicopper oxidase with cupredoxin domain
MRRALLVAVLALAAAGCAGKSAPSTTATTSAPAPSPSSSAASSAPAGPSPTAAGVDQTVAITYAGGKVSGVPTTVKVKLGSTVALVVTSDVADEVHFHGYDKSANVAKGGTVRIVFTATLPGRFEVELENLKRRLVLLQVQ